MRLQIIILGMLMLLCMPSLCKAETLSDLMRACEKSLTLKNDGLSDLWDVGQAFYCRGFVSGYTKALFSETRISDGACVSNMDVDVLTELINASYKEQHSEKNGVELAYFELQEPNAFIEEILKDLCSR